MNRDPQLPTWTSSTVALAVSFAAITLLLAEVRPVAMPAIVGSVGALAFAASLWLVDHDRWRTVSRFAVALLTVVVAAGIVAGTTGTVLVLAREFFPVETSAQLSTQSLLLLARVGIVGGAILAVFGATLGAGDVLDGDCLDRQFLVTIKAGVVPAAVGGGLLIGAVLSRSGTLVVPGQERAVGSLGYGLARWLLAPVPRGPHMATFLFLLTGVIVTIRSVIRWLPLSELLEDRGTVRDGAVETLVDVLDASAMVGAIGGVLAFAVERSLTLAAHQRVLDLPAFHQLYSLATATAVRIGFVLLIGVGTAAVFASWLVRRLARDTSKGLVRRIAPLIGGATLTVAGMLVARPILPGLLSWIEGRLPDAFATAFRQTADATVRLYGPIPIVVTTIATLVALTAAVVVLFRLAVFLGYLSSDAAGFSLASAGIFVAAAFAGIVDAPELLVFAGIAASLVVWDAGQYGARLGREVGRQSSTRGTELVHVGGTLTVAVLAVSVAVTIGGGLDGWTPAMTPTAKTALVGALAGIVLLVAALR